MGKRSTDGTLYVKIFLDIVDHPKVLAMADPAAAWAYAVATIYCAKHLTDGVFPVQKVAKDAQVTRRKLAKLFDVGLAHLPGHDCPWCPVEIPAGSAIIHDYLDHQTSRAQVEKLRAQRRAAGRKGARSRWQEGGAGDGKSHGNGHAPTQPPLMASVMADAIGSDGKGHGKWMAEGEGEGEGGVAGARGHAREGAREGSNDQVPPPIPLRKNQDHDVQPCGRAHDPATPCGPCGV